MRSGSLHVGQAARRSEQSQPPASERREKGLWTFLTWAFFLSQAIAAEEAMAASARRGAEDDAQSNPIDEAGSEAPRRAPAFPEPVDTAHAQDGASQSPPALSPDLTPVSFAPPDAVQFAAAHVAGPAHAAANPHPAAVGSGTIALLDEQDHLPGEGGPGGPDEPSANDGGQGILPPIVDIVDDVVGGVLNPIVETVGDVVNGVGSMPAAILAPVINQVVSPVLETGLDVLGDLLRQVGPEELNKVLDDLGLDSIPTVPNLFGAIAAPVLGGAGNAAEGAKGGLLAPVTSAADDLLGTLGMSSGSSLKFSSSSADRPDYEVMANGAYTDYGVTLQSGNPAAAGPASQLVVTAAELLAAAEAEALVNPAPLVSTIEKGGLLDGLGH